MVLIKLLLSLASLFGFLKFNGTDTEVKEDVVLTDEYDFIIVGAGTAGSVLARRLTDDRFTRVLLLEAGCLENAETNVPGIAPFVQLSDRDWQYKAHPSNMSCLAMFNNSCNLPRGKVLGGSSSINYMIYVRGNKKDYNHWESLGNPGWGYSDILPFFKKFEGNLDPDIAKNLKYHNTRGPQKVQRAPWSTKLSTAYGEAALELDYPVRDINADEQYGFMTPQGFTYKGRRLSSFGAFVTPIKDRENLDIRRDSFVHKIHFDSNLRATGVTFKFRDTNYTAKARKEVILSAGAFGSPHLMMVSGLGPKSHLSKYGIKTLVDLPGVGQNLQDHVAGMLIFTINETESLLASRTQGPMELLRYVLFGTGPLTTLGGIEGIAFINSKYNSKNLTKDWPDIELHFVSGSPASDEGRHLRKTLNLREKYWQSYLEELADKDSISIVFKLMRPRSRGYLELVSSDPEIHPKIVTNYFSDPYDMLVLKDAFRKVEKFGKTISLRRFGIEPHETQLPGCESYEPDSESYIECYLRHLTLTLYHYCGTAKMGPYWDPGAVVDSQLRVYGTSGLRVVDASIFPTIPTGNTNAPVLMVAEKAAEMIKDFWSQQPKTESDKLYADSTKSDVEETTGEMNLQDGSYAPNPRFNRSKILQILVEDEL